MLSAYAYESDDALSWQMSVDDSLAAPSAGDLSPASGQPPYPGLWRPRHLRVVSTNSFEPRKWYSVICNTSNSAWVLGLGAAIVIADTEFIVTATIGEQRLSLFS